MEPGTDPLRIGLIGDHDPSVTAHRAIPLALARATAATGIALEAQWVDTAALGRDPSLVRSTRMRRWR